MEPVFESTNFVVQAKEKPEVDRLDGGHLVINPKVSVVDRQQLSPEQAKELVRLTILVGEAMKRTYTKMGITLGRINYQDNGNWRPELHVHLYGRATSAKYQKYGDPVIPGNKPEYQPLNEEDVKNIRHEIIELIKEDAYSDKTWGFELK